MIRLVPRRYFEVTQHMMETLAFQHGAIDPDSGHIVCHQYRIGVTLAETPKGPVPMLVIENCVYVTAGRENVEAVLSGNSVEAGQLNIRSGRLEVGGLPVESYWMITALSYAKDLEGSMRLYKVEVDDDGRRFKAIAVVVETRETAVLLLVPQRCEAERAAPKTHM